MGYQELAHFSRAFKRAVGISPSANRMGRGRDWPLATSNDEQA
jgi:AraC-like DNA-binding protein